MVFKSIIGTACACLIFVSFSANADVVTFTDNFDNPAFTNAHWQDGNPVVPQTWSFTTLNGTDLGYHASIDVPPLTTEEPAVKILDNGGYSNADLYLESLVRIDSHVATYTVDVNNVFLVFGASAATSESYLAGINIHNIGIPSSSLFLTAHSDTGIQDTSLAQIPISIDFDTFYKLTVQVDSDQTMNVSLYDLNDVPLGSISSPKAFDSDNGVVAIAGRYASSFNNFYVSGTPAVPIPAAFWLFGSGLISLIGLTRLKSHV